MVETPQPDWDFKIDFRFSEIEAELFVIAENAETLERQLPLIAKSERERLEKKLEGLDPEERYGNLQWIDEYVDEVFPRLYRSTILVQLWAVFETAIIEISKYLQDKGGHTLDVDDVRGSSDYERALKYYDKVLRFPLIGVQGAKEQLDILLVARNAIAHRNGRVEQIKPQKLARLGQWEEKRGGIVVGFIT